MPDSWVSHGSAVGTTSVRRAPHMSARVCSATTDRTSRSVGSAGRIRGRNGIDTSTSTSAVAAAARVGASHAGRARRGSALSPMEPRRYAGAG